ncbi:MAG: sigma-54 dependent transcriptional regulator [Spirochaetales bacterium]|jgi:DNA-binding NtrC family response regulator|nr:sigma-54 dependent transcriptional regulator [Spirochaetales bacterium]
MRTVLLVDADPEVHACVKLALGPDFALMPCYTGSEALTAMNRESPDVILCEIALPDMNGLDILQSDAFEAQHSVFIAASAAGNTHAIVGAVKAGADEYVAKPYNAEDILETVSRCLTLREVVLYPPKNGEDYAGRRLVGESPAMYNLRRQIRAYSAADGTILITGESGTGKDLAARELHRVSSRSAGPFHAINCGAMPEHLFESEMFGSEKGAYTDAVARPGFFESSSGGVLFLDEVGELSAMTQVKLLRILEDRRVVRLGSHKPIPVDVRIIAATNRDLHDDVIAGRFRSDLFYRLDVLRIRIPPLRERREDIPLLCYTFLQDLRKTGSVRKYFSDSALRTLTAHSWPGNVRELKNVIERAFCLCEDSRIGPEYIQLN